MYCRDLFCILYWITRLSEVHLGFFFGGWGEGGGAERGLISTSGVPVVKLFDRLSQLNE